MASRGAGSHKKGADYERRVAGILTETFGVKVQRTPAQESAKLYGGDVNAHVADNTILTDFFWELKKREAWSIIDWYKKAKDDCSGTRQIPIVVASKNNEDDYVFLTLSDFSRILRELEGYRKEDSN